MQEDRFRRQVNRIGRRLRLGIVGGGEGSVIGGTHRFAARLDGRYDIVAGAFDIDPEKGRDFARELLIEPERAYGSYQELIEGEKVRPDRVDLVSILTPNHSHFEIAAAFVEAGFDILCEKPLTTSTADALALAAKAEKSGALVAVMYGYSGYPMIRQARAMVRAGEIGAVRAIETEYAFGNPVTMTETPGGHWRTTPGISGPSAVLGMIGTHAIHLGTFITDLTLEEMAADLSSFVPGRKLEDNAHLMLRYSKGARGAMWLSYVAAGAEQGFGIRIFGDKAGLEWHQENPNHLALLLPGQARRILTRGSAENIPEVKDGMRVATGHPEGFIEAFATIYGDVADALTEKIAGGDPSSVEFPGIQAGIEGVRFVDAAVESHGLGGQWVNARVPA